MPDTYLHPDHIRHNLAAEHTAGPLEGMRTVFGREWISRNMASVYRHFITGQVTAVTIESEIGPDHLRTAVRYTLTDDAPEMP